MFEDQSRLEKFKQNIKLRQPNLKQYQTLKVLSDQLPTNERDYVVIQVDLVAYMPAKRRLVLNLRCSHKAIRRFATTFMTRSYGRGTDFVCRDDGLVKNGGVHLIVTFYPQVAHQGPYSPSTRHNAKFRTIARVQFAPGYLVIDFNQHGDDGRVGVGVFVVVVLMMIVAG